MDMKKTTNKDNSQFPVIVLISVVLMFVFLIALMYFQIVGDVTFRRIFKAAASVMFILTAVFSYKYSGKNKKTFIIMLIGFIFALGGDVFLSFGSSGIFFVLGLGSFSLAHIFYTIAFCSLVKFSPKDLIPALIIAVPTIGFLLLKDGFNFDGMLPLVILYTILISIMVSKAISLLRLENKNMTSVMFSIIGAVLFFISDFILVFVFFYDKDFTFLPYINLIIYYSGQALLALSFLKGFDTKKS